MTHRFFLARMGIALSFFLLVGAGCPRAGGNTSAPAAQTPPPTAAEDISAVEVEEAVVLSSTTEAVGMPVPESGNVEDAVTTNKEVKKSVEQPVPAKTVSIDVTAKNFSFDRAEIRVKKGDTVTVRVTNAEGFHDWVIDEFNAKTPRLSAGGEAAVTFVADKAGTFEYYCSVGSHRQMGMVGKLIVE